jgi:hypothetical protein
MISPEQLDRLSRAKFWAWLAPFGNVVGVACGLIGVITDRLSPTMRLAIVAVGVALWAGASLGSFLVGRVQRHDQEQVDELKARIAGAGGADRSLPDHALRAIAPVLFKSGASWRLSLFVLEESEGAWYLRPKIRCAASEMYENHGRDPIPLESSVLRELKSLDLPASNEVGEAPDRTSSPEEWAKWQGRFIADPDLVDALRMPTRKYAWCAARQPGLGGRTMALVAETVQPGGINTEVLSSNLFPPILEMVARLVDLPEALDPKDSGLVGSGG